ncbi:hypothetical protein [Acetanaerobacterium elongatum]|uniref:Uncharacterized protein n=1 Tax=Acetanaerobacterium elongatum TaxID=258515 RepID=A0A1G9VZW8_9FIRM|nr:hypothetical protein [Acetanaerobacterium elongatum]SDM77663.1 hypothetical protein SAMN05192585_1053 [Acetanaerobacterium elongatum]
MNYERVILKLIEDVEALKEQVADLNRKLITNESNAQMNEHSDLTFYEYLTSIKGMKYSTAQSRVSNCKRVEKYEGDLEEHYYKDKCKLLLSKLEYSMEDQVNNRHAAHKIPIDGNTFNGTATLKQAVNLYINYLNYLNNVR